MDCPACARKVETAVNRVDGIVEAKVLFATEKLIITSDNVGVAQLVEQTILDTGFTFTSPNSKSSKQVSTGWKSVLQQNAQIIAIASAMAIAAAIKPALPQISEWMFVITCLAGLYPIGKKSHQPCAFRDAFCDRNLDECCSTWGALFGRNRRGRNGVAIVPHW
jgi:Cd2+/Zn2+-exporting ATPase